MQCFTPFDVCLYVCVSEGVPEGLWGADEGESFGRRRPDTWIPDSPACQQPAQRGNIQTEVVHSLYLFITPYNDIIITG